MARCKGKRKDFYVKYLVDRNPSWISNIFETIKCSSLLNVDDAKKKGKIYRLNTWLTECSRISNIFETIKCSRV